MNDKELALDVIWKNFISVIKVDLLSGEFKDLKSNRIFDEFSDYFAYLESPENIREVFALDLADYKNFFNRTNLLTLITKSNLNSFYYRRLINDEYKWTCLEIIKPDDFSSSNPYVLFTYKIADERMCNVRNAINDLSFKFHKILQVNLQDDSYSVIKIGSEEEEILPKANNKLSLWINEVLKTDCIHEDDKEIFQHMTNNDYMRKFFLDNKGNLRIRYRRLINSEWHWVVLEAIPVQDFSSDHQYVRIYVRDIEDEYLDQVKKQKSMEKMMYEDALSGLKNRTAYNQVLKETEILKSGSLGVIYADLNGLKVLNDTNGHAAGDKYIRDFSDFLRKSFRSSSCYRIGGDEFVVLFHHMPKNVFENRVYSFERSVLDHEDLSVSIGSSWELLPAEVSSVISEAEKQMYMVKKEFHKLNPEMIRF